MDVWGISIRFIGRKDGVNPDQREYEEKKRKEKKTEKLGNARKQKKTNKKICNFKKKTIRNTAKPL